MTPENLPTPLNAQAAFLEEDYITPSSYEDGVEAMAERERRTASIINVREIATYQVSGTILPVTVPVVPENSEILNGQQWFRPEPATGDQKKAQYAYRSVFDIVNLNGDVPIPATGVPVTVPHGLSAGGGFFTFTRIYGTATKAGPVYMPIPYASPTLNLNIEVSVTNTNIIVTVGTGQTALTQCYIVLEYLKA
jgi:hypothetical protein